MNVRLHEGDPNPSEHLNELARQALAYPDYGEVVMFLPDGGVDKMRLIKTGETELVTYKVGQKTMSFEKEVEEPIIFQQYASLSDYADSLPRATPKEGSKDNLAMFRNGFRAEHDPKYDKLRDAIREKAIEVESKKDGKEVVADCVKSCTDGVRVGDCDCVTWGRGLSYTDLECETVTLDDEKLPKEGCSGCGGIGVRSFRCDGCIGAGKTVTNPFVTVINNSTQDTATFRADIVSLIANDYIRVDIMDDRHRRSTKQDMPEIRIGFEATDLMVEACNQVGIDLRKDDVVTYWGGRPIEMFATSLVQLAQPMATTIEQPSADKAHDEYLIDIFNVLQQRLVSGLRTNMYSNDFDIHRNATDDQVKELASTFDLFMNDDMTISNYGLRLEQAPSLYDNLQEMISILAAYDYRLGYTLTGVATGESGPGLYVMDSCGNVLQELDSGYEVDIVLQNSLTHIRTVHGRDQL